MQHSIELCYIFIFSLSRYLLIDRLLLKDMLLNWTMLAVSNSACQDNKTGKVAVEDYTELFPNWAFTSIIQIIQSMMLNSIHNGLT